MFKTAWFGKRTAFAAKFLAGFLLVFLATGVVTFLQPVLYSSTARINLEAPGANAGDYNSAFVQTQFERLRSRHVLYQAIERLHLGDKWGQRYGAANGTLATPEAFDLLVKRMSLRQAQNTSLIEIRVYSEDPREAAQIANTVAEAYQETIAVGKEIKVEIADMAEPARRPVRPNIPLNLAGGVVLGLLVGMGWALLAKPTLRTRPPPEPALHPAG